MMMKTHKSWLNLKKEMAFCQPNRWAWNQISCVVPLVVWILVETLLLGQTAGVNFHLKECIDIHEKKPVAGISCDFENDCDWKWDQVTRSRLGFRVISGQEASQEVSRDAWAFSAPSFDAHNQTEGMKKFFFINLVSRILINYLLPSYFTALLSCVKI